MPIIRTYGCPECNYVMEAVLDSSQWDDPPPSCPRCDEREMAQQFKPVAIGGSVRSKAVALAEKIAAEDYNVANIQTTGKEGLRPKVRYKDEGSVTPSAWTGPSAQQYQMNKEALETAVRLGRETRLKYGSGLDVLQNALKTGAQPDLIANSKKISPRIW
jgi:putative FmdB family regulatory protein